MISQLINQLINQLIFELNRILSFFLNFFRRFLSETLNLIEIKIKLNEKTLFELSYEKKIVIINEYQAVLI